MRVLFEVMAKTTPSRWLLLVFVAGCFGVPVWIALLYWRGYALSGGAVVVGVAAVAAGLGLSACLRLSRDNRVILVTSLFACLIGAYLAETYFAVVEERNRPFMSARDAILQRILEFRSGGDPAQPFVRARAVEVRGRQFHSLSGLANVTTVLCREVDGILSYQSDRFGFNNPPHQWDMLPVDVVMLGDSFVHGQCVPPETSMASAIRRSKPRTLNLGMSGHGPLLEYAVFREYVVALQPAQVLWVYFEYNDLDDLRKSLKSPVLVRYLEDPSFGQDIKGNKTAIDAALRTIVEQELEGRLRAETTDGGLSGWLAGENVGALLAHLRLFGVRKRLGLTIREDTHPLEAETYAVFEDILRRVDVETKRWGGKLHFVYLPFIGQYNGSITEERHDRVIATARGLGLDVIDIHETFKSAANPLGYFAYGEFGGHFNASGYEVVAARIIEALERR